MKVFPRPQATTTAEFVLGDTPSAIAAASTLARGRVNLDALDVLPDGSLLARLGGLPELLASRADRLVGSIDAPYRGTRWTWGAGALARRRRARLGPARRRGRPGRPLAEPGLGARSCARCLRGRLRCATRSRVRPGWIACPIDRLDALDAVLLSLRMPGVVLRGTVDRPLLGPSTGGAFGARVAAAIDPRSRFLELERWIVSRL